MPQPVDILSGARTTLPVGELRDAIVAELTELGNRCRIVRDRLPEATEAATLVLAPHEVFASRPYRDDDELIAVLRRSILLVLAHPSSPEWKATLPYVEHAGALLHVSDAGIAAFKRLGRRVRRFPLGYHRSFDRWDGVEAERELDVAFVGLLTERRGRLLAEAAPVLAGRRTELRVPDHSASESEGVLDFVAGLGKLELLVRTRVLLALHADEEPAFGWLRAVQAISNGCVLVSEAASDCSPLQAGLHFVSGEPGRAHLELDALLSDPDRLAGLRQEAYRFLREELPLSSAVEPVLELAADLPRTFRRRRNVPDATLTNAREGVAAPQDEQLTEIRDLVSKQNAVLKKLFVDLRLLRRQVAQMAHTLEAPSAPLVETTRTPAAADASAPIDVSVVVTVHNYARFVRDALESALASEGVSIELVVVDDASSDASASVVRSFMDEHPRDPITLVEQRVNTGAQRARNLAFSLARAPLGFVLDADNLVYPQGIAKLRRALDADPDAGFAYGLMERFSEGRRLGLMNTRGWDPTLLSQEHYIDAMALIRVERLLDVGGYVTDQSLELGWEDYDLWLSFAMAGLHGAYVREIVGRYRIHGVSSLTMTTLETTELVAKLRERHAPFFAAVARRP